ncbi:LCP family protein [Rathayibacter iranicus]|uniref:LytR family transcriptional regulator n=2 Tax=Rathayibacter iranicus TaxID=59737 RepID=A0AAD1ENH3_9MICO|nr:LCP family protein [Rathayibacter iranicus]AZZ57181.1 LytR family transcriptional regulator [Rathayibacter iranicus]MWV29817.1 LytR family transcriptional regulator [Rathayibacter iranicus NCPPB 2253 = VKM Ac-1602]PPI41206.1 LytR family transcriptional regulator [Rathayibacter iranicus]PPI57452.1 LytR family transcriptional regulator [Rathayibacter iranicus]PPI68317.1 LytR family transcriptional regulator [Rathayibacter iranicus]
MSSHDRSVRHGRLRPRSGARSLLLVMAACLGVLAVSGASLVAIATASISRNVADNAVDLGVTAPGDAGPQTGAIEGGFSVLVVGTDNDATQGERFGVRDATLNDVNILLHVSADHRSATVISFPRDLILDRPDCTNAETGAVSAAETGVTLNSTFEDGGLACVNDTLQRFTGLTVPYAGWVSFDGVIEMSNAVGGVPICLSGPILDTDSGLDLPAGTTTVSGATALAFLRTRHGVGDGSDLSRISSQQQYLASLMRTVRSANTLSNFPALYGLAHAASSNLHLSTTMTSPATMIALALSLKDIDLSQMVFVQYPVLDDPNRPGKVVPDTVLGAQLMARVVNDQPVTLASTPPAEQPPQGDGTPAATQESAAPEELAAPGQTAAQQTCAVPSN